MSTHSKLLAAATSSTLLLAVGAFSCQSHDVCTDVVGSCLSLRVEGDGPFDSLRTTLNLIADVAQQRVGDTPGGPGGIELPTTLRIVPPDDVKSSEVSGVELAGIRGGALAATAKSPPGFSWPYGTHQQLTLRLEAPIELPDGGSDDLPTTPPDLSGPPGDMTSPPTTLKWRPETSGARAGLYGVWAGGTTQAFIVGENGTILSRQGDGSWRTDPSGTMVTLNSVAGVAGSGLWAVGQSPGAWRRDSMKWNQDIAGLNLGTGGELLAVAVGASAGELWAGDRDGRVWHRTGPASGSGTWQTPEQVFPTGQIVYGIASAGGAVFAVGDSGRVARRPDSLPGTAWKQFQYQALPTGDPFTLNAAFAFDKDTAVAVGTGGQLVRYSGGAWQSTPQVIDSQKTELFGVWGMRSDRVWAVGNSGLIVRVEGTRTTELARTGPQSLYSIFGRSESDIFAVGFAMGNGLILHGTP